MVTTGKEVHTGPQILFTSADGARAELEIPLGASTIGRSAGADHIVDSSAVSALHAQLWWDGERLALLDLDSTNGTTVNGRRAHGRVWLADRDRLQFGDAMGIVRMSQGTGSEVRFEVGEQRAGTIHNVGGNQTHINVEFESDLGYVARVLHTPSLGRAMFVLGATIALAGFVGFGSTVVRFLLSIFEALGAPFGQPPEIDVPFNDTILGMNVLALSLGLFVAGGVVMYVGGAAALAKATRSVDRRAQP